MNTVILVGRVTRDFTVITKDDKTFAFNTIAISQGKDKNSVFIPIAFTGRSAEILGKYVKKGNMLSMSGTLTVTSKKLGRGKDGKYVYTSDVLVWGKDFTLLPNGKHDSAPGAEKASEEIEDLPF